MEIAIMTISDYEETFKLWSNTAGMGMRSLDDSHDGIAKFLKRNPTTNFIASIDGKIVGVILCGHDGRRGYIYHAAVDEMYRGQGIGKALVKHALDGLKEEGINKAALVVFKNNTIGNEFWDMMGFDTRVDLNYRNKSINEMNI